MGRKTVGFLGCGKIGKTLVKHLMKRGDHTVSFIHDPHFVNDCGAHCPVVAEFDATVCHADLIVECATADVLKKNIDHYAGTADLVVFSMSAFSDAEFAARTSDRCRAGNKRLYFPHGAILGLDGIFDARDILTSVEIETVKNPSSLGRDDTCRTEVYRGCARGAVESFPLNANVHAAVALAGIGFDNTQSVVISDPSTDTNSHTIRVKGDGIEFKLDISSRSTGGVTGRYTPISACGSLDRILGNNSIHLFV